MFREAGAEWREAGCSMCIAMNGDQLKPGQYAVSTSNRNFEGRQGAGGRTFLASPLTAAAAAVTGKDHRRPGARVMEPIKTTFTSRTVVLPIENVDTDQIIPARFLKATSKNGLGEKLFADWRYDADGKPKPDFVLNRPEAQGRAVLVAGDNFGCGSSREHAPWALVRLRLPRRRQHVDRRHLPEQRAQERPAADRGRPGDARQAARRAGRRGHGLARGPDRDAGGRHQRETFPIDPFARYCLLNGVDELAFLLSQEDDIAAFETRRAR